MNEAETEGQFINLKHFFLSGLHKYLPSFGKINRGAVYLRQIGIDDM